MACNSLQQPELSSSIYNMFLCVLEIGHNTVLKNIEGATAPPAPPASLGLGGSYNGPPKNHQSTFSSTSLGQNSVWHLHV